MQGLSAAEIQKLVDGIHSEEGVSTFFRIERIGNNKGRVRMLFHKRFLRLGGTMSGPSLMRLVDASVYFTILGSRGPVYDCVTSNLNINFLRPVAPGDVLAEVELLKVGRKLAFAEFKLYAAEGDEVVAHGTCTYSLPSPKPK